MSISSLGGSPSQSHSISLLNPPNPSFAPIDSVPRGGILLNSRRGSDSPQARPSPLPLLTTASSPGLYTARSGIETPNEPSTPIHEIPAPHLAPTPSSPLLSPADSSGNPPRIRFAPLPDPRRPRSLSTGRNVVWKATEGPSGETTRTVEIRGVAPDMEYDEEEDDASEGEDDFGKRKSGDDGDEYDDKRGRRWSRTMGSWGKGTKKLLGLKDGGEGYSEGAPLKKSVSTGGFIGSSPFRWNAETERKANMQGLAPASPFARNDHRRNSSMENPSGTPLSSSPQPVRMLNGRVYGSRRLMEAAEREKEWREKNEPAFIEWGHGKQGAGLGSNAAHSSGGGFLGDAEEGSGMEWVKRRREERQRRAEEERRQAEGAGARSDSGASEGDPGGTDGQAGVSPSKSERRTPIIQVSEHLSPSNRKPTSPTNGAAQAVPIPYTRAPSSGILSKSAPVTMEAEKEHITEAIQVPVPQTNDRGARGVDIFGDGRRASGGSGGSRSSRSTEAEDLDEQVVEDEEESEEEDQEDDDDDEEEEDVPMPRTTSSAAGVEKVSRHKD